MIQIETKTQITTGAMWVGAFGRIVTAIGNTPPISLDNKASSDINLIGYNLQLAATTVLVDTESVLTLNKVGNIIQAGGLSAEVAGYILPFSDSNAQQTVFNIGNEGQALGTVLSFMYSLERITKLANLYNAFGGLLQTIGINMLVIAGFLPSTSLKRQQFNSIGSWIQAIGAIIQAIAQTISESDLSKFQTVNSVVYYK
ncbi:hypothetical protein F7984_10040 [Pradoshia sp. D12]|uniref:DUF6944 family repetitive protein n=1 Tax=Bacillaceae TaxID=186817 RepID=UPI00080AD19D|nr:MULTISPECIES: hypothetical protein [unclassified Bacillus (in: firmicutes)]OCA86677.1 hypothetical protein A8L44_05140 [Bacillus sp. FJAT-27986]QFK71547.1 hypothetical protein F7984_10040 [Pradoshia sp. D12]TPF73342.1 hypothetical protein FHY44_06435 [Bacillus sp. D12]